MGKTLPPKPSLGESEMFTSHERAWALVSGGPIYSAKIVFEWARIAFKSVGFVVLLEGV
jgi:hypothetical protein